MKIVLKQWIKDPKACAVRITATIMMLVYTAINTWIVTLIAEAMAHPEELKERLIFLVVICLVQMILGPTESYMHKWSALHCFNVMSNEWFGKLIDADFEMFTKYSCSKIYTIGEFLWQCTSVARNVAMLIKSIFTIITTLVAIYAVGGKVVLPIIGVYVAGMFLFRWLFKIYNKIDKDAVAITKKRNQEHENCINGFAEVRSFGTQGYHRKRVIEFNNGVFALKRKRQRINTVLNFSLEGIDTTGLVVVMLYAVWQIGEGAMDMATGMSLVMYVFRIIGPLVNILDFADMLSESVALADDFNKIDTYINTVGVKPENPINLDSFEDEISINDVSFAYESSSTVLNKINMAIPKGATIGICGSSGNGKSTLAKLLLHFYNPNSGSITIDGVDLRNIDDTSFRRLVGSIQQENNIFPGSIMANVTYGTENPLETEVVEACKRARIYDFIMGLPKRFETEVGPRGLKLSGGQKQRIALVRLFLKNPEIIVLDEATSALDNETETLVQEAIEEMKGKTIITIAHRLSTIKNCDKIYVVGNKGVLESGTHDELVELGGAYAAMLK